MTEVKFSILIESMTGVANELTHEVSNGNDQRLFIRGVKLIFDKNIKIGDKNSGHREFGVQ